MSDKCNCYRFSPRDSLSGAVAQIADYLSKHPGWNETELKAFIDSLNISNGVETFNGRSGNVTLNKDDVNNLLIANCYFAEADETIESIDVLALYKLGIRIVFTQYSSEVDAYTLAYGIEYYPTTDTAKAYLFSSGSGGVTGDIVSVNGKTGTVNLKVVDVSKGNSPDENAYIFIDESDDYPDVISSDSSKLGGQLPSYYASAEEVSKIKDDVAAITPDDTVVDGKPWTSKKIVDSLCMPIEATGNPVQVYPVEGYPLGVKASWEPVQAGSGDPSPDNIRPITGRDSVSITRFGKNLYKNKGDLTLNGVTFTANDDGSITANGTATGDAFYTVDFNIALQSGTYTLSGSPRTSNNAAYMYFYPGYLNDIGDGKTFTLADAIDDFSVSIHVTKGYVADNIVFRPQLELGATATPYEPYTGSTTDIALPETVYGGEVDAVSGGNNRTWRTITLTGEESSHIYDNLFYLDLYKDSSFVREKAASSISGKSSHYKYHLYNVGCIGVTLDGESVVYHGNGKYPISNEGIQEWKSYLAAQYAAGTPVQVCYRLAEPVPFTATGTQPIAALSGVNNLYTDAGTLTVTGREDPRHTIVELKNAIISLGGNI